MTVDLNQNGEIKDGLPSVSSSRSPQTQTTGGVQGQEAHAAIQSPFLDRLSYDITTSVNDPSLTLGHSASQRDGCSHPTCGRLSAPFHCLCLSVSFQHGHRHLQELITESFFVLSALGREPRASKDCSLTEPHQP